jgi:trk system potassium uptake protein TrkH
VLYLALVGFVTLLLAVAHPNTAFIDVLFEACSACGTVGLSTGVTAQLQVFGKCVVMAAMFVGRLGPVTLLLALTSRVRHAKYSYPSEHVVIG